MNGEPKYFYLGSDGKRHYMANESKNMQEKSPHDIRCGKCSELIVAAKDVKKYSEKELTEKADKHKCRKEK